MQELDDEIINSVKQKIKQAGKNGLFSKNVYEEFEDLDRKVLVAKAINYLINAKVIHFNPVNKKYKYNPVKAFGVEF